ncbi:MAG TPA: CpsD/CapB family tyrosine-protein kinase [Nitrospira sp.]|nr:CpsD/CapB family tyrosine-protein kinase [Nitrospira sp.]
MEPLHSAMERFKKDEQRRPVSAVPKSAPSRAGKAPVEEIVYTQTRTIDIADEVLRERRVLAGFERGAFLDSYKILRTQVMHRLREHGWNVLGITSPGKQEGKTLTAVNLAISLAMDTTQTVLLVDADLTNPSAHHAFGLEECGGLVDYLLDGIPVEHLLIHPGIGRFVLMPGGRAIQHSAEALTSPKMASLVEEFKHRYPSRIVLFDLPPLLQTADVLAFSPYTDALLLVVEDGKTSREDIERALQLVKGSTPVLGTVLNKAGKAQMTPATMKRMLLT